MTPEEKGVLLLAHHEGKVIQFKNVSCEAHDWQSVKEPVWADAYAYRIKPEPKIETVKLHGRKYITQVYPSGVWDFDRNDYRLGDTHVITFNLIDSKPDPASIKIEEL
jgi:hypothetical protein